ncbi:MAG: adenosylmethionine decarboxylase [Deltaproteobacteria bacterium]|nr:adenosylmethionine decarboxylase [Deltaproteobacteria bacterium]NIS76082.1 adenosylmethionine decarboxylase [Deltaproteobacteria bacterium]
MVNALGRHVLLELSGCPYALLNDLDFIRNSLIKAAERANVTVISENFSRFNPHGISGVLVIAESHISIHTWPEYDYAAIDIFTCGDTALPDRAVEYLIEAFRPGEHRNYVVSRGIMRQDVPSARCEFEEGRDQVAASTI